MPLPHSPPVLALQRLPRLRRLMPAPKRPNTAEATRIAAEVAVRRGDETAAKRLRDHGWIVLPPEVVADDASVRSALAAALRELRRSDR